MTRTATQNHASLLRRHSTTDYRNPIYAECCKQKREKLPFTEFKRNFPQTLLTTNTAQEKENACFSPRGSQRRASRGENKMCIHILGKHKKQLILVSSSKYQSSFLSQHSIESEVFLERS